MNKIIALDLKKVKKKSNVIGSQFKLIPAIFLWINYKSCDLSLSIWFQTGLKGVYYIFTQQLWQKLGIFAKNK